MNFSTLKKAKSTGHPWHSAGEVLLAPGHFTITDYSEHMNSRLIATNSQI